jgi:DNA-binding Xre family transcriptional regulator
VLYLRQVVICCITGGMKTVRSKLRIVVAERATREGRALSMRRLAEESGASIATVNRLANNTIRRIPVEELAALCRYLKCDVGDLLAMEEAADAV